MSVRAMSTRTMWLRFYVGACLTPCIRPNIYQPTLTGMVERVRYDLGIEYTEAEIRDALIVEGFAPNAEGRVPVLFASTWTERARAALGALRGMVRERV